MNIQILKQFFDYQPILDEDPQFLVDQIKEQASHYLSSSQLGEIQRAYEYAHQAHQGQMRQSGEHYISHIVQATKFLMLINPDLYTIQGCLLHDVIEDCEITPQDIEKEFGSIVRTLCEGVTKVSKIKYRGEERQVETIKKTFFAMSQDLRVIFIKLADRIHNIQTLGFHSKPDKQQRIINETLEIYVPIAERLGLYQFQYLLENGCFYVQHPKECNQIISYLDKLIFKTSASKGIDILQDILIKHGISNTLIKGRLKSPWSIYRKLIQKVGSLDIKQINDILAFRIITDTIPNCYLIMGIIHNTYTPLVHKIKDYIVVPKSNGYQSIHSIILGMFSFPVEIQIRTQDMDRYAEYGVAAHFAYKEHRSNNKKKITIDNKQSERVYKLQEIVKSYQDDNEGFQHEMKVELLHQSIFVYTPKGEIIELKEGSTVLDFAFKIHSELGLKFKHALVNGAIVPIDFHPKTGDVISISTRNNKYSVNQSWLNIVKSSHARNQIYKHIKLHHKDEIIQTSLNQLKHKLIEQKLPEFKSTSCLIRRQFKDNQDVLDSKLIELYEKGGYQSRINEFYKHTTKKQTIDRTPTPTPHQSIVIDGQFLFDYILCPECIEFNSPLIAKSDHHGIKIHHIGCKALHTMKISKLLSAHYQGENEPIYRVNLKLKIANKIGNLNKVLRLLQEFNLNIQSIAFVDTNQEYSIGDIVIELHNPNKLTYIIEKITNHFSHDVNILEQRFSE
ncbi:MAG TPA: RelA/SpoT family protein [Candidatus Absconditabacterales bacterium]|nr:RelA/SpoT family protein [Candidatus Absconditabacterales bacterium]